MDDHSMWMRLNLDGVHVLVVGGGDVAFRKVSRFLSAQAQVCVIAPMLSKKFQRLKGEFEWQPRALGAEDCDALDGYAFVVLATGDTQVEQALLKSCKSRGVPVHVTGQQSELSSFFLPTSVKFEHLDVALFLRGASPWLTKKLRDRLTQLLVHDEPWWSQSAGVLRRVRGELLHALADMPQKERAGHLNALAEHVFESFKHGEREEDVLEQIDKQRDSF